MELPGEAATRSDLEQLGTRLHEQIDQMAGHLAAQVEQVEGRLGARVDEVQGRLAAQVEQVEGRLGARVDEVQGRLAAQVEQVEGRLAARLEQAENRLAGNVEQLEARMIERINAAIHESETKLLSAFFAYQEHQHIQFAKLKADNANANRATELRLDNLESRIIAIEKKILGASSGG